MESVQNNVGKVMSSLIPFDFDGSAVRVVMKDLAPWFVAKDVCQCLDIANHKDAVSRLDEDERDGVGITDPLGRRQVATCISESGLFCLIFTSRKEEAKRFRKWVTSEVLPALRKHGTYTMPGREFEQEPLPSRVPGSSLKLKQELRAQAMRAAVQAAKLDGGNSEDVERIYARYCELFSARPESPHVQLKSIPAGEAAHHALVVDFITQEMEITDIKTQFGPTSLKSKSLEVYELFKNWCRDVHGMTDRNIPSHIVFGSVVKRIPGVKRVSPVNRMFYNLIPTNSH
ncbi:Bro-N domain-containing protein [Maridesulfovibrio sp.]|uniref:BRO-N domain-containing protein n=1 Tax=Maridesulfovibrio sp. TaxID=2795000 RepID=UPI003B003F8B